MEVKLQDLPRVDNFVRNRSSGARLAVEDFLRSDRMVTAAKSILGLEEKGLVERVRIFSDFRGYIFEQIAYYWLRSNSLSKEFEVLSPEETFGLYNLLFPKRDLIMAESGLQKGIRGISIPDGIIFKRQGRMAGIDGVCEYSLNLDGPKHQRKIGWLNAWTTKDTYNLQDLRSKTTIEAGQYLHRIHPALPGRLFAGQNDIKVVTVVPSDFSAPSLGEDYRFFFPMVHSDICHLAAFIVDDITSNNVFTV